MSSSSRELRQELQGAVHQFSDSVQGRVTDLVDLQHTQLLGFGRRLDELLERNESKLESIRTTVSENLTDLKADAIDQHRNGREELARSVATMAEALVARVSDLSSSQRQQLETLTLGLNTLSAGNEQRLDSMRNTIERKLGDLQTDNALKLEQTTVPANVTRTAVPRA